MKFTGNLSILIKSLASPILASGMIVVVAAVFMATYLEVREETDRQAEISALRVDIQDVLQGLSTAHLETLKATNWKQSQVQDELIVEVVDSAGTALDGVQATLERRTENEAGLEHESLTELFTQFQAYRKAADETLGAITIDVFMATMFLNDTQVRLVETEKTGTALLERVVQADKDITAAVNDSLTFARVAVLTASALAVLLSGAAGVFFGRAISRPVSALTDTMRQLADGDTGVDIPGTELGDEVGQMARTVQVFKDNMIRNEELSRQTAEQQQERVARAADSTGSASGEVSDAAGKLSENAGTLKRLVDGFLSDVRAA